MRLITIFFIVTFGSSSSVAGLPETIDAIRHGIVSVGIARPPKNLKVDRPSFEYLATGFAVGDGTKIVTNNHVVSKNLDENAGERIVIFVGRGNDAEPRPARIFATDKDHDIALLEVAGPPIKPLLLDVSRVREGQEIAFTGYPIGMVLGLYPVTGRGIVSAITPIVVPAPTAKTLTAAQIQMMRNPFNVYQLDAIAYPGASGSPVYRPDTGEVIGVVNSVFIKTTKEAVLKDPSGIAYAIPVKYVQALLEIK